MSARAATLGRRLPATRAGRVGLAVVALLVLVAVLGPVLAPHDPDLPIGAPFLGPRGAAPLGTDYLGRDVLSRMLCGGWTVLFYASIATVLAYAGGLVVGLVAGYSRTWLDPALMRVADVLQSFPALVFLLLLAAAVGRGEGAVIVGTAIIQVPFIARIVRTATLQQSVRGFVAAAVARGETTAAILRREILPNISAPLSADVGLRFTASVILIASVNFLGLGLQPPAADWGVMVSENRPGIALNPAAMLAPAIVLGVLTIALSVLSDAVVRRQR